MQTLIIQREVKTTTSVELPLPYYAAENWCGGVATKYWAITGQWESMTVTVFPTDRLPYVGPAFAKDLPADHTQIGEEEFRNAFDTAIGQLQAKACVACPNHL